MSIKIKHILILVSFIIIPILIFSVLVFSNAKQALMTVRISQLNNIADLKKDKIETFFRETESDLRAAQNFYIVKQNLPGFSRFIHNKVALHQSKGFQNLDRQISGVRKALEYKNIMLTNAEGVIVYCSNKDYEAKYLGSLFPNNKTYKEGKKDVYFSDISKVHETDSLIMTASAPLEDFNGKFIGEIIIDMDMELIYKFIAETTGLGNTGESFIVKMEGNNVIFLSPLRYDPASALNRTAAFTGKLASAAQKAALGEKGSGVSFDYYGFEVLAAWRYIPSLRWGLVTKIKTSEAFLPVIKLRNLVVGITLIILALGLLIAIKVARGITNPILALQRGTEIIGSGNLDYKVGTEAKDEVGQLSRLIDSMSGNLKRSQEEILQSNEELQTQQEELKVTNEELEEQSRALQDSQAELEQTNEQLEAQKYAIEQQRDILNEKNITLKKIQILLEERSDEVQKASRYKSEFLANMSHELRTPLNSSLILSKLLADNASGNLTPEQLQYANSIYSSGNDLLNLINDILDLSKVEAGMLEIRPESVFLPNVLKSLESSFQPLADQKKLQFHIKIDPSIPETMITDRQRLEQILKNLLSNAFKFTEKGQITLHVSQLSDGRLSLVVIDTGIGIPKLQQELIFEPFRQADGTTNRKYGGTGLGLSISRDLAKLLGGNIEVKSVLGEGSRFTLVLPLTYDQSHIKAAPLKTYSSSLSATAPVAPQTERQRPTPFLDDRDTLGLPARTLLVIEDEPQFAQILFNLAHELHYKCVVAQDAEEGLHLAQSLLPDAILLDMRLPDRSGLTVLDQLKEDPTTRHIPVHIVSVHNYMEKALQMGAIGYILKPAKLEELKAAFAKIEFKLSQKIKRILIVEDDKLQRESIVKLIADPDIEITAVELGIEALDALKKTVYDCIVIDLKLPDMSGEQLLKKMTEQEELALFPPVIVYTGRSLTRDEEDQLRKYSRSIIIKGARSPERLLDEVGLFLHRVESKLSPERQQILKTIRSRDDVLEGRKILVVDDDSRNIFALTAALEKKGATIVIARNGLEALTRLEENPRIDLVLMDIMMPVMDGLQATHEIRKQKRFAKLPIIAVTAKASKNDQVQCMEAGANDYLAKPIDLQRLFSLIRVWMPKLGRD